MLLKDKMKSSKMMFGSRRHKAGSTDTAGWAVSYVDMLTLLLCFFIIFYNLKPTDDEKPKQLSALQKIALSIQTSVAKGGGIAQSDSKSGNGTGTGDLGTGGATTISTTGSGSGSGTGTAFNSGTGAGGGFAPYMIRIRDQVKDIATADTNTFGDSLEVNFKGISFFNTGSITLTPAAQQMINKVVQILKPSMHEVRITVQGHTDTRLVANKTTNVSDNWELSVLRATSVLKRFAAEGFPQDSLSAEGFAATRAIASDAKNLAEQRKITLRIEPK